MLNALIRFALTQRVFVVALFVLLVSLGVNSLQSLPIDAFPDISPTQINVIIKSPGMTAEEIEAQITRPLETELLGIPNQDILRSTTKYGITSITIDFLEGTDIYWARQQVSNRVNGIWSNLPDNAEGGVAPLSTPMSEMFMFTLEHPNLTLAEKKHYLQWLIRPTLRTISGVADINILGGETRTIQFQPDYAQLHALGLTLAEVETQIANANLNGVIGKIDLGIDSIVLRTEGRFSSIENLKNLFIVSPGGVSHPLAQLGTIDYGRLPRYGGVTKDGYETAQALVVALKGANTKQVVMDVKATLEQLKPSLPDGAQLNVFYDRTQLIDTAVSTINESLIWAIVLVSIILSLFLGNLKSSIVVALSIPISVAISFYLMDIYGLTANLMSFGGLVIAIGMLVDSSVVVVENVSALLSKQQNLPRLHLILRAAQSVAKPVVSGTLIVIAVFLPLLTLVGLEGKLFTPVALTIVFAMTSALVTSLTIIPVAASYLMGNTQLKEPVFISKLREGYSRSLKANLTKPVIMIATTVVLTIGAVFAYLGTGKIFLPTLNEGDIIVQLEKVPTISLEESMQLDMQIEKHLLETVPELKQLIARTGSDELGLDPMSLNETDLFMELQPRETWRFETKSELEAAIRDALAPFKGINIGFTQPIQMRVSEMLTGSSGAVSVKVFGDDVTTLSHIAGDIAAVAGQTQGSIDVQTSLIEGGDYINIRLIPQVAAKVGIDNAHLANYLRSRFDVSRIGEVLQGRISTPIVISERQDIRNTPESLATLAGINIPNKDGTLYRLDQFAEVELATGPALIERENGQRFSAVSMNIVERDISGFVEELSGNILQQIDLPTGYHVTFGGEFENQERATKRLITIIPVVLLMIVLLLFSTFRSLALSLIILLNIPVALIGGIFGLYLTGSYISVPASVGFIALMGIAILNGVVMVSHFEQMKFQFSDASRMLITAASSRLRPILMTATTAVFGLIPLILATGPGSEIQKPLAIVVISGLITATPVTLYLLPYLYSKVIK
jgi:cobalt-zinc-cadmium resistance protein CzcA